MGLKYKSFICMGSALKSLWPSDAIIELVNTGSGNSLLPDDAKQLPESMLTRLGPVARQ